MAEKKVITKACCPHCGENLCTERGIYLFLYNSKDGHKITHLSNTMGDYTVPLCGDGKILPGTPLTIKCPRCQTPINKGNHCMLNKVEIEDDSRKNCVLNFLSTMGEHGTIVIDEKNNLIGKWGENVDLLRSFS